MIRSERQEKMTELRKEIEKKDKMIKLCLASHDTFNNCHDIEKALKAKERLAKHKQQKQVFDFFYQFISFIKKDWSTIGFTFCHCGKMGSSFAYLWVFTRITLVELW